ncbi:MAG: hypothetical protein RL185_45, partial [Bacteroidota bacterium]
HHHHIKRLKKEIQDFFLTLIRSNWRRVWRYKWEVDLRVNKNRESIINVR